MKKMKRVSMDYSSHQSRAVDEEARVRFKHQTLLQDFLELQKEFVSKKRKLQIAKQKREALSAEVRFLRLRCRYLLKIHSAKLKPEQELVEPQNLDMQSQMLAIKRNYSVNEAVLKNPSPVLDLNPNPRGDEEEGGGGAKVVWKPLTVDEKPKNCLISGKRVGKKKISWQDQMALKV